ncbi:MAG: hypothetical protein V3S00_00705 [Dehalococcoidia bacterium]
MVSFIGGSAAAMAGQIAEGFFAININTIRKYSPADLAALKHELEKQLREARALVPPQDDAQASQTRHRRISRISSAAQIVSNRMTARR